MELFDYSVAHGDTFIAFIKHQIEEPANHDSMGEAADAPRPAAIEDDASSGKAEDIAMEEDGDLPPLPNCDVCKNDSAKDCKSCGCTECGGKDDEEHTLSCDECGRFFHMRCLYPPLTTVPEEDWFCPDCFNKNEGVVEGEKTFGKSARKAKMPSATQTKSWGGGMACVGTTKKCTIVDKDHTGPIPGVHVGQSWRYRIHVSESGVHRPPVGGIAGKSSTPAVSIVLAAGYPEDEDHGDEFIYTGSGGYDLSGNKRTAKVQVFDQELTRQNLSLARACAAPINADVGAEAADWRSSSPIRVCRSYKVAKKHPEFAPAEGVRYDGIYKIYKYRKERGHSGPYVWRFWFRRDDPEPMPWTPEGQLRAKELGLELYDPDGANADGRSHTLRKPTASSSVRVLPNAVLRELIRLDSANDRIWTEVLKATFSSESAFLEAVTERMFICAVCQELVQMPVTTPCGHNACAKCLCRSLNHSTDCPVCRASIKEMGDKERIMAGVNQNLVNVIMAMVPTYGKDWAIRPAITSVQRARRTGQPIVG
ncbi:hypothetical protein EC988_000131 [Linderina pennispora]|nr:hypothetical protein EC988_000131 [Linderina pennispora]